ncbi:hypothetical protein STANM309S_01465 [Streptomyces tanashiensis]
MGLGVCVIMIAVGAILTFATDWEVDGVDLDLVGLILMAVGIIGTAVYTSILRRRRMVVPGRPDGHRRRPPGPALRRWHRASRGRHRSGRRVARKDRTFRMADAERTRRRPSSPLDHRR